jgi:hypothetical protein
MNGRVHLVGSHESDIKYQFRVQEVTFWVVNDTVKIDCKSGNCIRVTGPGISPDNVIGTSLAFSNHDLTSKLAASFSTLASQYP